MTQESGKVKPKTPPQRTYVCRNQTCSEYNRPRTVTLQHLGQEIYIESGCICGFCGWVMQYVNSKGFKR